jgi:hypothetical protein
VVSLQQLSLLLFCCHNWQRLLLHFDWLDSFIAMKMTWKNVTIYPNEQQLSFVNRFDSDRVKAEIVVVHFLYHRMNPYDFFQMRTFIMDKTWANLSFNSSSCCVFVVSICDICVKHEILSIYEMI